MVDPQQDIEPYVEAAAQKNMRITHIFETHVQADHASGARRLATVTGAPILVHESAPVEFLHPDGVSLLVTDKTRGPEPWFVLTGDTLFAGGVGRPDLLGEGAEAALAEQLYESLHTKLLKLPDHIEVFPAHFGGSACGKGLSGKPGSTIGFERRFNPALQFASKAEFVSYVLTDLPPQPEAFAENRRHNLGRT